MSCFGLFKTCSPTKSVKICIDKDRKIVRVGLFQTGSVGWWQTNKSLCFMFSLTIFKHLKTMLDFFYQTSLWPHSPDANHWVSTISTQRSPGALFKHPKPNWVPLPGRAPSGIWTNEPDCNRNALTYKTTLSKFWPNFILASKCRNRKSGVHVI